LLGHVIEEVQEVPEDLSQGLFDGPRGFPEIGV
jgi:hypothetical protein